MSASVPHEIYVPGHVPQKIAMLAFGLILLAVGCSQLAPRLWLLATGARADAEAVAVLKTRAGAEPVRLPDDLAVERDTKVPDRRFLFWNLFRFRAVDGSVEEVRLPSPAFVKPAFSIIDADGLPRVLPVVYDPGNPQRVLFPTVFSTWVFPALLSVIGLITTACAALILSRARRPIELPVLPPAEPANAASPSAAG